MTLAERLKYLRSQHRPRLSQEALSKKLGFNRATYARYETGDNEPDYETLIKIADFYGVTLDYLIRGEKQETQSKIFMDEAKRLLNSNGATIRPLDGGEVTDEMISAALEILAEQLKNRRKPGDVKSGKYPSKKSDDEG
ncbi:helix-turn-helix domain-containing protein [Bacillus glycinifermentans]|uniref:helix-turn-helix domain-containing protein n=1 Tax=Bacillus glycinifermentans TaxID=1664069 RepID=UPI001582312A|nr:XRE family transcriptional regulator [Bacillus glycinifermentans]NUJ19327.1 helix-turn-helix domain-containing protein [Bacillus glycinifermentans]